jgi:hypothetical protein
MRRRKAALFFALVLAACTPAAGPAAPANPAEVERLFDDALEPPTVGITLGSFEYQDTETFLARARLAEAIYRAQVTSILPIASGGWLVELTTKEVLRGEVVAPRSVEVEALPGFATASLIENFRPNFERANLLVFARRYARANERVRWHVHTVADTAEARERLAQSAP